MNNNIVETIKERLDIAELIRQYVPGLKRSGKTWKACCPFHKEKTPSFTCSSEKGLYYCFGCQEGGDIFAFLMKMENLTFNEALRKLADLAGVEYQPVGQLTGEEQRRIDARKTYPVEGEALASDSRKGAVVPVGLHREADDLRQLVAEYRGDIIGALVGGDVGHHKVHIRIGGHIEAELNSFVRRARGVSCKLRRAQGHEGQGAGLGPVVRGRGGPGLKGLVVAHGLSGNIQLRFTAVLRPAPAVRQIPGPRHERPVLGIGRGGLGGAYDLIAYGHVRHSRPVFLHLRAGRQQRGHCRK